MGRATLYDVADVDIGAGDADTFFDHLCEQFTCASHEGQATLVFFCARPFAYEEDISIRVAVAEHDLGPLLAETTSIAVTEMPHYFVKAGTASGPRYRRADFDGGCDLRERDGFCSGVWCRWCSGL